MTLMRRQSLVKFAAPLCETIVETPTPHGREALVRVTHCGLCHSDLHIIDGYADLGNGRRADTTARHTLPLTLGHEMAGVVEKVGGDVAHDMIGRNVAVFPWIGCGGCRFCANGDENLCTDSRYLGVKADGGFASHVLVPDAKYLLDHAPLSASMAAALMCSGLTAYGALKRLAGRPHDRNLLCIGAGGVGLMALAMAPIVLGRAAAVADTSAAAREAALTSGASMAYDPADPATVPRILAQTGGGFDAIIDFVGSERSLAFAVDALARGGKICVAGLYGGAFGMPAVQWVHKRMSIEGVMVGTLHEAKELLALARDGRIVPPPMRQAPMVDVQTWIGELRAGRVTGRVVLTN